MSNIPMDLVFLCLAECFVRLKLSESWRGLQKSQEGFSKEDKEALNGLIALVLVPIFKEKYGIKCDINKLAKYVLFRVFRKAWLWDSKPTNKWFLSQKINFDERAKEYVSECLMEIGCDYLGTNSFKNAFEPVRERLRKAGESLRSLFGYYSKLPARATEEDVRRMADWICDELPDCGPDVELIYEAAKCIATVIEFEEVRNNLREDAIEETERNIFKRLADFKDYPVVSEIAGGFGDEGANLRKLFKSYSWSRYTFRWQTYRMPIRCSILTHMLETACVGYLAAFEKLQLTTDEDERELLEALMIKTFQEGLFHDIAEIWVDDIPSPAKEGMGIRKHTEEQENLAIEQKNYALMPKYVVRYFKENVMLEDQATDPEHDFYKAADYFSADLEVWWNVREGASSMRLLRILKRSMKSLRSPAQLLNIRYFLNELKGRKFYR